MTSPSPLRKLLILVIDGDRYYKYAKVDWLDGGQGLLIYDYNTGEKLSRHPNQTYLRVGGAGQHGEPSTAVPFSNIEHEMVRQVAIPSDATNQLPRYHGDPSKNALVFSSTVMQSNGTFAAELVDDSRVSDALEAWQGHPDYLSAQTIRANEQGQSLILSVLNSPSA